ncbi:hypothetical protein ACIBO1_19800 [Micromonospora sp. NPDC049903]
MGNGPTSGNAPAARRLDRRRPNLTAARTAPPHGGDPPRQQP